MSRKHLRIFKPSHIRLRFDGYAKAVFRDFPTPYWSKLQSVHFEKKEPITVLDIGCGPGNWAIAAAKYNRNASVTGIDINNDFLQLATEYRKRFSAHNAQFLKLNYRQIQRFFETESFDYVFTVNVLQYLDERVYFEIVSKVLKGTGRLLMFSTEQIGWYLHTFLTGLKERNFVKIASSLLAVIAGVTDQRFPPGDRDHVVSFRRTRRIAMRYGIELKRIPQPCDRLLCFPFFFDIVGKTTAH